MKKWTLVDQALTPDGSAISLHEHDGSYSIRVNGVELMSTRRHASEERIAALACSHLQSKRGAMVLVGGLGFGFTLQAALAALAADARVCVAEILPAVVAWNRDVSFPLAAKALADPRVSVIELDVGEVIRQAHARFDAIILDVDNGPAALTTAGNQRLYDFAGLQQTRAALRPGGCVAFWSAGPSPTFARTLARAGFAVEVERCRAHGSSGGRHTLFLGRSTQTAP